jgi:hypothetical protein
MLTLEIGLLTGMVAATPALVTLSDTWEERPEKRPLITGWFLALGVVGLVSYRAFVGRK